MKKLKLLGGKETIVDDDVYEWASKFNWKLTKGGYVQMSSYNLLHRIIVGSPKGKEVHHINGNKLDNRRENLKLETPSEHQQHHFHRIVAFQKSRQKYPDIKKCVVCNNKFRVNPRKRKRNKCCSPECAMYLRIIGRKKTGWHIVTIVPQVAVEIIKAIMSLDPN
jgi:hypothetical protein